jgi:protein-tyrosine phosphatase
LKRALFVCLGNICRSPLAEAAFRHHAATAGIAFEADSAGTAHWHVGKAPDPRSQQIAAQFGVDITGQRARQVAEEDFRRFTHIFAMDHDNLEVLQARAPVDATAELSLLLDLVPGREGQAVADPYYGGAEGFAVTWSDVSTAATHLVRRLA